PRPRDLRERCPWRAAFPGPWRRGRTCLAAAPGPGWEGVYVRTWNLLLAGKIGEPICYSARHVHYGSGRAIFRANRSGVAGRIGHPAHTGFIAPFISGLSARTGAISWPWPGPRP